MSDEERKEISENLRLDHQPMYALVAHSWMDGHLELRDLYESGEVYVKFSDAVARAAELSKDGGCDYHIFVLTYYSRIDHKRVRMVKARESTS